MRNSKKLTYGHQENKIRRKLYAPARISVEMVGFEPIKTDRNPVSEVELLVFFQEIIS